MPNRKIKIALVTSNPGYGGAEKSLIRLSSSFKKIGFDSTLIFFNKYGKNSLQVNDSKVFLSEKTTNRFGFFYRLIIFFRLNKFLIKNQFTHLISTLPISDLIVSKSAFSHPVYRVANEFENYLASIQNSKKQLRKIKRYKKIYNTSFLVALTDSIEDDLVNLLDCESTKIHKIHNYIDHKDISFKIQEIPENSLNEDFCVHMGRYVPQKRHDLLLDTWKIYKNLPTLYLLCEEHQELHKQISLRKLEERVKILGYKENPYPWIAKSKALILCSDYEGFPTSLIEAMYCSTRILITDGAKSCKQIMEHYPSYIARHNDPVDLGLKIQNAIKTDVPSYENELKRYSEENAMELWLKVLNIK